MSEVLVKAEEHLAELLLDVDKAKTREEHVRITARANEASTIVDRLRVILGE